MTVLSQRVGLALIRHFVLVIISILLLVHLQAGQ